MAGKSGDQNRRAPGRGQRWQGYPATPGQAPHSVHDTPPPAPASPGFSPLHKKTQKLPLPAGKGVGGWGQKIYDAAGSAGDQNRRASHRGQRWQGYPATPGQASRSVQDCAPAPAPSGFSLGDARGEAPCIRKPKNSPFPPGRGTGDGGWGKNLVIWLVNPATKKSSHPSKPTAAKKTVSRRRRPPLPPALSQHPPQDSRDEPSGATDAPHTAGSA